VIVACAFAAAYCGFLELSGNAQPPATSATSAQKPAVTNKPVSIGPAANVLPPAGAAAAKPPPGKDGIESDESFSDDHTGITTCRNWIYTRDDMVVTGATARFNRKLDTLDADDPVTMDDPKHHLTADKAHVEHVDKNKSLRTVILTGHAVMVLKPEKETSSGQVLPAPVQAPGGSPAGKLKVVSLSSQPPGSAPQAPDKVSPKDNRAADPPAEDKDREDAKAQQRHGGTITCDKIEYKTAKKFATLTGHVVFKQKFVDKDGKQIERTMTCEHAENDGKANVLHLFKPVHFEDNDGQVSDSKDDVLIGTKEGEETVKMGHTKMSFTSPDEDEDSGDSRSSTSKDPGSKETKRSTVTDTTKTSP